MEELLPVELCGGWVYLSFAQRFLANSLTNLLRHRRHVWYWMLLVLLILLKLLMLIQNAQWMPFVAGYFGAPAIPPTVVQYLFFPFFFFFRVVATINRPIILPLFSTWWVFCVSVIHMDYRILNVRTWSLLTCNWCWRGFELVMDGICRVRRSTIWATPSLRWLQLSKMLTVLSLYTVAAQKW